MKSHWKLYAGIILIMGSIAGVYYFQTGRLFQTSLLKTSVAGISVAGLNDPITFKFILPSNKRVFETVDLNQIRFEVNLPKDINNYFNAGEDSHMTTLLDLVSPTFKTYHFSHDRNLRENSANSYIIELSDFVNNFDFLIQNPGPWNFEFHLADKSGSPLQPGISETLQLETYPLRLDTGETSRGLRVYWKASNIMSYDLAQEEGLYPGAFSKELTIHVVTSETPRSSEEFPLSQALHISADNTSINQGYRDLFLNNSQIHSILVTLNTSSPKGSRLYYSNLRTNPDPAMARPDTTDLSSKQSLLDLVKQAQNQDTEAQNTLPQTTTQQPTNIPTVPAPAPGPTTAPLPKGDFNKNGQIDSQDFLILSNFINLDGNYSTFLIVMQALSINMAMSQTEFINASDINGNGTIDISDLNYLYTQGQTPR